MLNKKLRLKKRGSFTYLYKRGINESSSAIRLIYIKSKGLKIGFSVGNKIGKSVIRNKIKRQLRYCVRQYLSQIKNGYQMIFMAKPEITKLTYKQIDAQVHFLLKKASII